MTSTHDAARTFRLTLDAASAEMPPDVWAELDAAFEALVASLPEDTGPQPARRWRQRAGQERGQWE